MEESAARRSNPLVDIYSTYKAILKTTHKKDKSPIWKQLTESCAKDMSEVSNILIDFLHKY